MNKKLKIALDIDGCIMDYTELLWTYMPLFCEEHKIPYIPSENLFYEIKKEFNLTRELEHLFWCTYGVTNYFNDPPRSYTKEVIDKIRKINELYILTARQNSMTDSFNCLFEKNTGQDYESFTINYFEKYKLNTDGIFFNCKDKVDKILELDIDCILEDSPVNIKTIYEKTNAVIFVMDNYCNRDIKNNDRIIRVFSMNDFYKKFVEFYELREI